MKKYFKHKLTNLLVVNKIVTIHYFEFDKNFSYGFEKHDFWEIVYADKNDIICSTDEKDILLKEGQLIFHKPNINHALASDKKSSPNVFIASFVCHSEAMQFFENKIINLTKEQIKYIYLILDLARQTFNIPHSDPNMKKMELLSSPALGGEQAIKNLLELLLIDIMKSQTETIKGNKIFLSQIELENKFANDIIDFLNNKIYSRISIDDICKKINYSKSYVFRQFKKLTGQSIMDYYINLKIKQAKIFLKENVLSITQISDKLCFDTPNYFSKTFKKITSFTPSEYKKRHI